MGSPELIQSDTNQEDPTDQLETANSGPLAEKQPDQVVSLSVPPLESVISGLKVAVRSGTRTGKEAHNMITAWYPEQQIPPDIFEL